MYHHLHGGQIKSSLHSSVKTLPLNQVRNLGQGRQVGIFEFKSSLTLTDLDPHAWSKYLLLHGQNFAFVYHFHRFWATLGYIYGIV